MSSKAYVIAQKFVTQKLVSPKTADFPFLDFQYKAMSNDRHAIISYVDAQNALGAIVRKEYVIVMKFHGGDWANEKNWTVEQFAFK